MVNFSVYFGSWLPHIVLFLLMFIKCLLFKSFVGKYYKYIQSTTWVLHAYQWESREVWDASFKKLSEELSKILKIYIPILLLFFIVWLIFVKYRIHISILSIIYFIVFFSILMSRISRIHQSFCPDTWYQCSKADRKRIGGFNIL